MTKQEKAMNDWAMQGYVFAGNTGKFVVMEREVPQTVVVQKEAPIIVPSKFEDGAKPKVQEIPVQVPKIVPVLPKNKFPGYPNKK